MKSNRYFGWKHAVLGDLIRCVVLLVVGIVFTLLYVGSLGAFRGQQAIEDQGFGGFTKADQSGDENQGSKVPEWNLQIGPKVGKPVRNWETEQFGEGERIAGV